MIARQRLRVIVSPSQDGGYAAEGVEIDYVATGETPGEAMQRFEEGFARTLMACVERNRPLGLFEYSERQKW